MTVHRSWFRPVEKSAAVGLLLSVLSGCDSNQQPNSPTVTGTGATAVDGVVRLERPPATRIVAPPPAEAGVQVSVIAGMGQGSATLTDARGAYRLDLPTGIFKLRWSRAGFLPLESEERRVEAGDRITMPEIVLKTAPWAIAGMIADSRQNPVEDAQVTIDASGAFPVRLSATSGGDGRYRVASTTPHFDTVALSASGKGLEPLFWQRIACCDPPADTVYDIRLVRVLKVTMTGPDTLRVGESVELPIATIDLDNDSQRFVYILPVSSDPAVVAVGNGQRGFVIRGVRPGIATITFDYRGVTTTLQVRVVE